MMRFIYDKNRKKLIINHENTMFKTYTEIIGKYSALFKQYECDLKISISWSDFKVKSSDCRLPFHTGYSCYISCEVQKEGKTVRVKDTEGEVEYYSVEVVWQISSIERGSLLKEKRFFKPVVELYTDIDEVEEDMRGLLQLLDKFPMMTNMD